MKTEEQKKKHTEYMRTWRKKNPDKIKLTYEKRKEYLIEWRKKDYQKHKEEYKRKQKEYYNNNKEEVLRKGKIRLRKWIKDNPEKVRKSAVIRSSKRRAKLKNSIGKPFSVEDWENLCESYFNMCVYCNKKLRLEMDHIIPISKGGIHELKNIVPSCRSCNATKINKSLLLFLYSENIRA